MILAGAAGPLPKERLASFTQQILQAQSLYCALLLPLWLSEGAAFGASSHHDKRQSLAVDGPCSVAAVARLDNRDELEERVGRKREYLTDAELLAAVWRHAGEDCLAWIVGDYAFAAFDSRTRSVSLIRDITGQVPLYYTEMQGAVAFASTPAALRTFAGGSELNRALLAKRAMAAADDSDSTYFAGVSFVEAGHIVQFRDGEAVSKRRYWDPTFNPPDHGDRAALVEEYRHLLDEAVQSRITGASLPIASHLSGGFDSSSVTATAARILVEPDAVIGFTCAPKSTSPAQQLPHFANETALAKDVADKYGIRHVIVRDTPPISHVIRTQGKWLQRPVLGPFNMAWWIAIRKAAQDLGTTRILIGQMGNVTLNAGTVTDLSEWIRRYRWITWARQTRAAARRPDLTWRGTLYNSFWPWLPPRFSETLEKIFLRVPAIRRVSFVRPEWQQAVPEDPRVAINAYKRRLPLLRELDPGELRLAGIASNNVEELDPFSDRRIIEFSLNVPVDQLYWNGIQRPLMREALSDRLPSSLFQTFGRGQQAADWALLLSKAEAYELMEEIRASRTAQELLDIDRMVLAIDNWPTENWTHLSTIYQYRIALVNAIAVGVFAADFD